VEHFTVKPQKDRQNRGYSTKKKLQNLTFKNQKLQNGRK